MAIIYLAMAGAFLALPAAGAGSFSNEDIETDLGDLGEISVQFRPSGELQNQTRKLPKGCDGPPKVVRRLGTFVGIIHFVGEAGYTAVDATK